MEILNKSYRYKLENKNDKSGAGQVIQFVHKEYSKIVSPDLTEHKAPILNPEPDYVIDGTTHEEVMLVLIDRMKYIQSKYPCRENAISITKLEEALMWQYKKVADKINKIIEP